MAMDLCAHSDTTVLSDTDVGQEDLVGRQRFQPWQTMSLLTLLLAIQCIRQGPHSMRVTYNYLRIWTSFTKGI